MIINLIKSDHCGSFKNAATWFMFVALHIVYFHPFQLNFGSFVKLTKIKHDNLACPEKSILTDRIIIEPRSGISVRLMEIFLVTLGLIAGAFVNKHVVARVNKGSKKWNEILMDPRISSSGSSGFILSANTISLSEAFSWLKAWNLLGTTAGPSLTYPPTPPALSVRRYAGISPSFGFILW